MDASRSRAPAGAPQPNPRAARSAAKKARLEAIAAGKRLKRVRVVPSSDEVRRVLKHPNGMAFRSSGSVEWPLDRFTTRRLREGAITLAEDHHAHADNHHKHAE